MATMKKITDIKQWQSLRKELSNRSIGFVPTMGHLHLGHLSLCQQSKKENDITVVSIFVNPTQFNETRDFTCYPRSLEQDSTLLAKNGIDYLFLPQEEVMYADNYEIKITEAGLSGCLEGEYRPGHFDGVLTIVLKLLNLIQPARIYFGEKDYQQLLLIQKMVSALFLPVQVRPCQTIRESDGLAFSSRNSRLTSAQREKASSFPRLLHSPLSTAEITSKLQALGFKVDYVVEKWQRRLAAVWLDEIRLIDNIPK